MEENLFADRLKETRIAMGLTMEKLGREIGRSKSTISRWESGERNPKMFETVKLERVLGVSAEYLMYGEEDQENTSTLFAILLISRKLTETQQAFVLETAKSFIDE